MPVWEDSVTWPNRPNVLAAIRVLQEDASIITISVDGIVVGGVVRVRDVDCRVDDGDVVLAVRVQSLKECLT